MIKEKKERVYNKKIEKLENNKRKEYMKRINDLMHRIDIAKLLLEQNTIALESIIYNRNIIKLLPDDTVIVMENNNDFELEITKHKLNSIQNELFIMKEIDNRMYKQYKNIIYSLSSKLAYWNTILSKYL